MLRRAGLALSLGALAAYGLRNAMAESHNQMHLDASGSREVVFCHQCEYEWYKDDGPGLKCPRCQGEVTEIVSPESDPRTHLPEPSPDIPPELEELRHHNPWATQGHDSDPDEADIEEHITRGPHGVFIQRTIRSGGRPQRQPGAQDDPAHLINDFQTMIGNLMGPNLRMGQVGRSGPDSIFPPLSGGGPIRGGGFRLGGETGPRVVGGRYTFTTGTLHPRNADGPQPGGPPVDDLATYAPSPPPSGRQLYLVSVTARPDQLASILGSLFGNMGPPSPGGEERHGGMPMGLPGLLAQLLNPQNAVHGDAVYSQEALDRIVSQLMEQHPTSNAPGPASAESISALPKKSLDEKMLGPEGKGECSVCMDDVYIGDEVVSLPCNHWFHEACASAWLGEHNTCPICRKGIDGEANASSQDRRSSRSSPGLGSERSSRRGLFSRRLSDLSSSRNESSRNEARLEAIRDIGRLSPTQEGTPTTRWQASDDPTRERHSTSPQAMPGAFDYAPPVRRASQMSDTQRDPRRANTSGSDHSRSSTSGNSGNGGPMSWIRDRFGNSRRNE
ncbi:hypothetical protein BP6252_04224 [Coleophoma cylindrospora]|uniref:RING-type E3 ubiquitin transferase n=1 Tax=Coleophoma cylindrospora TaxID=1849047 RepID=A0A3D8RZX3_9HELO|nr:hypothetical protein BP6252_04224 [Coleophoma cylindrospora]